MLSEELQRCGIAVAAGKRTQLGVKGEYALTQAEATAREGKELAIKLSVTIVDVFGEPVGDANFESTVKGESDLIHLVGPSVSLDTDATFEQRDEKLREAVLDEPKTAARAR